MTEFTIKVPDEYMGVDLTKLKDKHKAYCEEYCRDFNAARAARAVGYAERYAYIVKTRPDIQAYIQYLIDTVRTNQIADREEILQRLTMTARGDVYEDHITPDGRTVEKGAFIKDQLKANELLMKYYGMLKDVQDINQTVTIVPTFEDDFVDEEFEEDSPEEVV